ncbi:MAG: alanine--tRNA ligase [Planctomycetota bacterium]
MPPTSTEVRQQFLDFFLQKHGHTNVRSSSVVPYDDPTLLFANAGMNQFKPYFLGAETPPPEVGRRAVNTQKCIRAGGKHNDLDDVGKDTYHHTFFEMLGNWSFGDYFKAEAIDWAWELLTQVWGLDPERLHVTYFEGDKSEGLEPDHEARDLWLRHLPGERIHTGNKKDNFWEMGDTGPCGPCSEIHYDRSPDKTGGHLVNADAQDTVVEIWNLVFIQFNRNTDGSLVQLPAKHVDTGMGFERIVRVLQGKDSNYDTDVFSPIFSKIQEVTGARAYEPGAHKEALEDPVNIAYRVIADHVRCLTFALADGAHCGNKGRDAVLRTILRRAVRFGHQQLGVQQPFVHKIVPAVVDLMGPAFPEITKDAASIAKELEEEEISFRETLASGIKLLNQSADEAAMRFALSNRQAWDYACKHTIEELRAGSDRFDDSARAAAQKFMNETPTAMEHAWELVRNRGHGQIGTPGEPDSYVPLPVRDWRGYEGNSSPVISGANAFVLYATHGFPIALTRTMAEERGFTVDEGGFQERFERHQEISRGDSGATDIKSRMVELVQQFGVLPAEFVGFTTCEHAADSLVNIFELPEAMAVTVDETPFYGEQGGQVGDRGSIKLIDRSGQEYTFLVEDTQKIGAAVFHLGRFPSDAPPVTTIEDGSQPFVVHLAVDKDRRAKIEANHTSTHLLNRALRDLVNPDAMQKGSLVDEEKLRFDFAHNAALTEAQVAEVEEQVRRDIDADLPVHFQEAPQEDALQINGLRAVFGEKYPPKVRVVSVGAAVDDLLSDPKNEAWADKSIEFCGGTHLKSTKQAEAFVIAAEEAVSKGVRRITAWTGSRAQEAEAHGEALLQRAFAAQKLDDDKQLADEVAALLHAVSGGDESASPTSRGVPLRIKTALQREVKMLQETLKAAQKKRAQAGAAVVVDLAREVAEGYDAASHGPAIVHSFGDAADAGALRSAMDVLKKKLPEVPFLLAGSSGGKVALLAVCPKAAVASGLKAGDWIKAVAPIVGGGGGGRPDQAQAGGKDPSKLDEALAHAKAVAAEKLG